MLQGEMFMDEHAHSYVRQWNENRPEPTDEFLRPWWRRERETVAKLSMILCLADGKGPYIRQAHVSTAIKILKSVEMNLPDLINYSQHAPSTEKTMRAEKIIKKRGTITRTQLARGLSRYLNRVELNAAILDLKDRKCITESRTDKGGIVYHWDDGVKCVT
jgi:hypothetical protein